MEIKLKKRPKSPIIIEGFPGFGLVGTISTEFLIDHLKTEQIGTVWLKDMPAMVAIHEGVLVNPIGIFYNSKYNLVFLHVITSSIGIEWEITEAIMQIAHELKATEIITLEGVGSMQASEEPRSFYYTNREEKKDKLNKAKIEPLKEGIVMGVTSALLLKEETIPIVALFAEAQSNLPDSKASAKIIEAIDKYLGLNVDYKPLLKQAEKFEQKIRGILDKGREAMTQKEKKQLSYVG